MSSYGLLPHILNPTRETGDFAILIDNTFSNNISNLIQGGNILTNLIDHYSQFIMIQREKMDFKNDLSV